MTKKSSLLKFPCAFPMKIMGKATKTFQDEIVAIIQQYYPELEKNLLQTNMSKNGNFLAISVTVYTLDQVTLDALYQALSQHPDIKMVL